MPEETNPKNLLLPQHMLENDHEIDIENVKLMNRDTKHLFDCFEKIHIVKNKNVNF